MSFFKKLTKNEKDRIKRECEDKYRKCEFDYVYWNWPDHYKYDEILQRIHYMMAHDVCNKKTQECLKKRGEKLLKSGILNRLNNL